MRRFERLLGYRGQIRPKTLGLIEQIFADLDGDHGASVARHLPRTGIVEVVRR